MVTWMIDSFGREDQRQQFLPGLISMDAVSSYCLTEPSVGSDAANLATRAVRDGDHYVVNGAKQFISGAGAAGLYLVMVRTGDEGSAGISALLVENGTPGLSFGPNEKKMGWNAQPTRPVLFYNVHVPVSDRLGEEESGFKIAMSGLNGGRLNIGACSLGGAQSALKKAIRYMGERSAFGRKLNDFQALQFRLADMATELEAACVFLLHAASALDAGDGDVMKLCAMAKRLATDTGFDVANAALQLHGG